MKWLGFLCSGGLALFGCARREAPRDEAGRLSEAELEAMAEERGPGWQYVRTVDEKGRVLDEGWEYVPPPEAFRQDGLSHLGPYVEKLAASNNWFSSVDASTPDGTRVVSLWKMEGRFQIPLNVEWRSEVGREQKVREFFRSRGMKPIQDYLAGNGDVPDATRILSYPVDGDVATLTALLKRVAVELCGISEADALEIKFEEHRDERRKYRDVGNVTIQTYSRHRPEDAAPPGE